MALPTRCQTPGAEYQTRVQTGNDASPISLRASLSGNQSAYLPASSKRRPRSTGGASLFSARSNDLSMMVDGDLDSQDVKAVRYWPENPFDLPLADS